MYQKLLELEISVEILFSENLLTLSQEYLNSDMYFRVLDLAFGLIQEGIESLHQAVIIAIL